MSKRQSRAELLAAGHRITEISVDIHAEATGIDEINGDSELDKLRRMSGLVDANENTIQGQQVHADGEGTPEQKEKARAYRRALADAFAGLLPPGLFIALFSAPLRSSSSGLATSFKDTAAEKEPTEIIKLEEVQVSQEIYEVLSEETREIEEYLAEYAAETDPAKREQMAREIQDLAGYYKMKVDLDAESGPKIFGHAADRVKALEEYFLKESPDTPKECTNKVCVFHVIPHTHTGGRNVKVNVGDQYDQKPQEVITSGEHLQGNQVAPALHLH